MSTIAADLCALACTHVAALLLKTEENILAKGIDNTVSVIVAGLYKKIEHHAKKVK